MTLVTCATVIYYIILNVLVTGHHLVTGNNQGVLQRTKHQDRDREPPDVTGSSAAQ